MLSARRLLLPELFVLFGLPSSSARSIGTQGEPSKLKRSLRPHRSYIHPLNHLDGEFYLIAERCSQMRSECRQSQVILRSSISRKLPLFTHHTHAFIIEACLCFWITRRLKQIEAGVSMWTNAPLGGTPVRKLHECHVTSTILIAYGGHAEPRDNQWREATIKSKKFNIFGLIKWLVEGNQRIWLESCDQWEFSLGNH